METKLKPFDLEAAKNGAKVVTRDGHAVRIICYDRKNEEYPIVALVGEDEGAVFSYSSGGRYLEPNLTDHDLDLFMAPVKHEGWVNVYKTDAPCFSATLHSESVYLTKDDAMMAIIDGINYIATVKLEWEE